MLPASTEALNRATEKITNPSYIGQFQTDLRKKAPRAMTHIRNRFFNNYSHDEFLFILAKVLAPLFILLDLSPEDLDDLDMTRVLISKKAIDRFYHEHMLPSHEFMGLLYACLFNLQAEFGDSDWLGVKDDIIKKVTTMVYVLHTLGQMK